MNYVAIAIILSLVVHLLIAVGTGFALSHSSEPEVAVELDLSSVELSFAEEVKETAAVVPLPPPVSAESRQPRTEERPPERQLERPLDSLPPDPQAVRLPDPEQETAIEPPQTVEVHEPEQVAAPRQARIDAPPKPKRTIRPEYPRGARQRGEQGSVQLEIRVNAEGLVETAEVLVSAGFQELDEAAVKAVKAARFTPAKSGSEAVAALARLTLTFKLK